MDKMTAPFCAAVVENTGAANAPFEGVGDGLPPPLHDAAETDKLSAIRTITALFPMTYLHMYDKLFVFNVLGVFPLCFSTRSFVFIYILALFRHVRCHEPGSTPRRRARQGLKVPPPPTPPRPRRGVSRFPALDKEGLGVVDFCADPLFSYTFWLCSLKRLDEPNADCSQSLFKQLF